MENHDAVKIRPITDDEAAAFRSAMMTTFGGDASTDVQGDARLWALVERGRAFAAFDGGLIVGTAATFEFVLMVPGGHLPMAGLTMVSVRPTHRRRGILRRLMKVHLDEARGRGVPLSGLWASEASIYRRFGYGVAAESDDLSFRAPGRELPDGPGDEVAPLDTSAPQELPLLFDAVRKTRPGMLSRSDAWWRWRRFTERPEFVARPSPRRHILARRDGVPTGYVTFRQRFIYDQGLANGSVEIDELVAVDTRAELSLWRFLCCVDLFPQVTWWNAPVDSLLPWVVSDPRRLRRRRTDTLWLRIDDVCAVLAARTYSADGVLRIEVDGQTYELRVERGVARCRLSDAQAELRIDRSSLGSIYLGCARVEQLARAGLITGEPSTLALADRMFATPVAPWCPEVF